MHQHMSQNAATGKGGEALTSAHLRSQGFRILHTNWRSGHLELDIVASNGEYLAVVEVKTRSANYCGSPSESITKTKIRRITEAADVYRRIFDIDLPVRFDISEVVRRGGSYMIERYTEDAFYAPVTTYS
jgi:putative endonuclease